MKILVCGDRNWKDDLLLGSTIGALVRAGDEVVEGDAPGADRMAGGVASALGLKVHAHPADWARYGKAAGPKRNQAMLDAHPDIELVLAFHPNIGVSKGTADMVRRARRAGIRTFVIATVEDAREVTR